MTAKPEKVDLQQVLDSMTPSEDSHSDQGPSGDHHSPARWRLIDHEGLATDCDLPEWEEGYDSSDAAPSGLDPPDDVAPEEPRCVSMAEARERDDRAEPIVWPEATAVRSDTAGGDRRASSKQRSELLRIHSFFTGGGRSEPAAESGEGPEVGSPASSPAENAIEAQPASRSRSPASECLRQMAESGISLSGLKPAGASAGRSKGPGPGLDAVAPSKPEAPATGIGMPTARPTLGDRPKSPPARPSTGKTPSIEPACPSPPKRGASSGPGCATAGQDHVSGIDFSPRPPQFDAPLASPQAPRPATAEPRSRAEASESHLAAESHSGARSPLRPSSRGIDPDLIRIMDIWPTLSPTVQRAILAMLEATRCR